MWVFQRPIVHVAAWAMAGGSTVNAATTAAPNDHTLLVGIITTVGVLGAASIAGFFQFFSNKDHNDTLEAAFAKGEGKGSEDMLVELRKAWAENEELKHEVKSLRKMQRTGDSDG